MKNEGQTHHSHREAADRFPLALFVMAELLCTAGLIAWLVF